VFRADSAGEYVYQTLHGFLAEQGTLSRHKHHHMLEMAHVMMIVVSLSPHFWAEAVSTSIYLINI
jgi:hypothetical protein